LFTHDRRPFIFVAEAAPVARAGPRVEFELTAVIITSVTQIALLRSNQTPTVQRVTLNQTIDGWTLAEVAPDSVVLNRGTETVTVPLRPDLGASRSGQAARTNPRGSRN
jgi:type II secretory pathway component PulC